MHVHSCPRKGGGNPLSRSCSHADRGVASRPCRSTSRSFQVSRSMVTCVGAGRARGGETNPGEHTARRGGQRAGARARRRGGAKLPGAGEERETMKRSGFAGARVWMGTTRAALWRGGARATRGEDEEDDDDDEGPRRDGEGGGRRRWEGAAAAVAGDGALRRRKVARPAAARRDHRQGPQELRAHAQPAARHQVGARPPHLCLIGSC